MRIILIAGARPNFMKIAPIITEIEAKSLKVRREKNLSYTLVHTGQHYDNQMSKVFFKDLELPTPDIYLGIGSGTHAEQTAKIMIAFEKVCLQKKPDLVIVVGDVNSTLACTLVSAKLRIKIAHIEAGLRSFDRSMPEEINRIVTDSLSDFLFTSCEDANENLKKEGISQEKILFVGNVMIDTLIRYREKAAKSKLLYQLCSRKEEPIKEYKQAADGCNSVCDYGVLTLHRPSNVDFKDNLRNILEALMEVSRKMTIIFPAHPRTRKQIKLFGYEKYFNFIDFNSKQSIVLKNSINLLGPLPYLDFLNLMSNAKLAFTDSGGIQEETTILGIPCLTLRKNTERPVTITEGTNVLVGTNPDAIISESIKILNSGPRTTRIPKLWDGKAAERIVGILENYII